MIKDKKEVRALLNKYLTDEKGINALGFISYHTFDKTLIEEDKIAINDFFRENFALHRYSIKYQDLLKNNVDEMWLSIDTIFDVELLDEFIAFGIAANVLSENLLFRFDEFASYPHISQTLNESPEDLAHNEVENYLNMIKKSVLPRFKLQVSEETLRLYEEEQVKTYSLERKKELLLSWWDVGMQNECDEKTRKTFLKFLDEPDINGLIYLINSLFIKNDTSLNLAEMIKKGTMAKNIALASVLYYQSTPEIKQEIEEELTKMFDEFSKIGQKKKRLK